MNPLLKHYKVAVQHPHASGFEHLNMLMIRDELAAEELKFNAAERRELALADSLLLREAEAFHQELSHITSLAEERMRRGISAAHWWWYLDVLRFLPLPLSSVPESASV